MLYYDPPHYDHHYAGEFVTPIVHDDYDHGYLDPSYAYSGDKYYLGGHAVSHREHHDDYHRGPHGDVYVDHHDIVGTDVQRDYQLDPTPARVVIEPTIYGDDFDAHYHAPSLHEDPEYYGHAARKFYKKYYDHSDSDSDSSDSDEDYADYMRHVHAGYRRHHYYDHDRYHSDSDDDYLDYHQRHHRYRHYDPVEYEQHLAEKRAIKLEKLERKR